MMQRLRPSEIRFIQDTINDIFQDGGSVNETALALCEGRISINTFPPIKVVKFGNKYFSFDNRRLYVFRVAEYRGIVSHIPVQIVPQSQFIEDRYTTSNEGRTVTVRRGETLPHCKDRWLRDNRPTAYSYTVLSATDFSSNIQVPPATNRQVSCCVIYEVPA